MHSPLSLLRSATAAALLLWPLAAPGAASEDMRHVLVLHAYQQGVQVNALIDQSIRETFRSVPDARVEVFDEYMDVARFSDRPYEQELFAHYRQKYTRHKIDLVIAVAAPALDFCERYGEQLFPAAPVVYCTVYQHELQGRRLGPRVTGVPAVVEMDATLNLALQLHPGTRRLVVIAGTSEQDLRCVELARQRFAASEATIEFDYLIGLPMAELRAKVAALSAGSLIYYLQVSRDGTGRSLVPREVLRDLAQVAHVPIYGLYESYLGTGIVGGRLINFEAEGTHAAGLALRLLAGEAAPRDEPRRDTSAYMFDWRVLRRWRIAEDRLPADSVVWYRAPSLWDLYRWHILGAVSLCLLEALLIAGLLVQRARRQRLERSLDERLRFEMLVSELSADLIHVADGALDQEIQRGLARIGAFLGAERGHLSQFTEASRTFRITHSWAVAGVPLPPAIVPAEQFPWVSQQLRNGKVVRCVRLEDLPAEAVIDRQHYQQRGTQSFLVVPLSVGGSLLGALGFSAQRAHRVWTEAMVQRLRLLGEVCASALARTRAEIVLRESEERFRLMADAAPIMIWLSGLDKGCTYCNQRWLEFRGRSLAQELGTGWAEGLHPEDRQSCLGVYYAVFDARQPFTAEYRLRRHDGEYRWMLDTGAARFDGMGNFIGYIGTCLDITERRQAEQALRRSREELQILAGKLLRAQEMERARLAREMHDDLSQRLAALAIETGQLEQSLGDPREIAGRLQVICDSLIRLSKDVHALSRQLHPAILDDLGLVDALRSQVADLQQREGITVEFEAEGVPADLPKDVALSLYRITQEALRNIVKYAQTRRAQVTLVGAGTELLLTITDQGRGFDLGAAGTRPGLGLASMEERARLIGAEWTIQSQPGQGTTISVLVPLSRSSP